MLIVAQNKSSIVNLDNVEKIFGEPEIACLYPRYKIVAQGTSGERVMLGEYKCAAQGEEILQKIAKAYKVTQRAVYEMPNVKEG